MTTPRSRALALLLGLAIMAAACGGTADTTTTTANAETTTTAGETTTSEAAVEEPRSLVVYSGRSEDLIGGLVPDFEAASGIDVEVRYAGTGELAATLIQEGASSPADVFYAQDPAFIGAVALEGLLQPLPAEVLGLVPDHLSDDDGLWVGVTARTRVVVVNPDLTSDDQLPETIWDVIDPVWKGRIGVAPTNGSFVAFVSAFILAEGEEKTREWLEGLAANEPVIFEGNSPIVAAVNGGEVPIGLANHYYLLRIIDETGSATAVNHSVLSGDPGSLVMPTGAGILASAANTDEAIEFIEFLLSEDAQRYFLDEVLEYPTIDGIGTPPGQTPLSDIPTPDINLSDLGGVAEQATTLIAESGLT